MKGTIIKSTGSWYTVMGEDRQKVECRIKGIFRTKLIDTTNPIAVGDRIEYEPEPGQDTGLITHLYERDNYIIRKSINLSRKTQIIAANMDQALLIITLARPRTSLGFIDRFLVTAEAYHIPAILVFNKTDIYKPNDLEVLGEIMDMYEKIGYPCFRVSALTGEHMEQIKSALKDKTTLITGHSGVGKSTFINYLVPGQELKTASISDFSKKGVHTTTFAEMFELPEKGFIIDTPGIKELGVVNLEKEEISHYFPEMKQLIGKCRFNNCLHINEPACAVIQAVMDKKIAFTRYENYLSIVLDEDNRH